LISEQPRNNLHPCRNAEEIEGIPEETQKKCRRNRRHSEETQKKQKLFRRNTEEMQKKQKKCRRNAEETQKKHRRNMSQEFEMQHREAWDPDYISMTKMSQKGELS
jgi:hypothetical protein